jgi:hypothetical protein
MGLAGSWVSRNLDHRAYINALTGLALKFGCPKSGLEYMLDASVMEEEEKEEPGYEHLDGRHTKVGI